MEQPILNQSISELLHENKIKFYKVSSQCYFSSHNSYSNLILIGYTDHVLGLKKLVKLKSNRKK